MQRKKNDGTELCMCLDLFVSFTNNNLANKFACCIGIKIIQLELDKLPITECSIWIAQDLCGKQNKII